MHPENMCDAFGRRVIYDGDEVGIETSIETHSAFVFLSRALVFKVRKPVHLGFLDYSTRERRQRATRDELSIGNDISPHVYVCIAFLTATHPVAELQRDADGEPVLVMRRLDDRLRVDRTFASADVAPQALHPALADCARFHAACDQDTSPAGYGSLERTCKAWEINFAQLPAGDDTIPLEVDERRQLVDQTAEWLHKLAPVMRQRIVEGRIRQGHGDLRAEHVYLTQPWSVIDPLEFNRELRFTDTAAEIGFLAMELDDMARRDVADSAIVEYARLTRDDSLTDVTPFFKRYRAVVRAKVEWIRSRQVEPRRRDTHLANARRLFELALSYEL